MIVNHYKWHSINIVPHISIYSLCEDDSFYIIGRVLSLTIFGHVINIMWRTTKRAKYRSSNFIGPIYSRKNKTWKLGL